MFGSCFRTLAVILISQFVFRFVAVSACGPKMAASLKAFRADCYLSRSDWLKLLIRSAARMSADIFKPLFLSLWRYMTSLAKTFWRYMTSLERHLHLLMWCCATLCLNSSFVWVVTRNKVLKRRQFLTDWLLPETALGSKLRAHCCSAGSKRDNAGQGWRLCQGKCVSSDRLIHPS